MLWTDPPYGVSYEGKTAAKLRIENDGKDGLRDLIEEAFTAADRALAEGSPLYIAHPGGERSLDFGQAFLAAGWSLRQTLIWVKDSIVLGHLDYQYRHEQILYGFKPGDGRLGRGGPDWHGDDAQGSLLEFDRPKASSEHPTMKPPELIEHCLRNSSAPGTLVLDPFAGSGSTLIACEASGRAARLIELDPRYCDVICDRYEALPGRHQGGGADGAADQTHPRGPREDRRRRQGRELLRARRPLGGRQSSDLSSLDGERQ